VGEVQVRTLEMFTCPGVSGVSAPRAQPFRGLLAAGAPAERMANAVGFSAGLALGAQGCCRGLYVRW